MSDEMEKQFVEETTETAETVEITETVNVKKSVAETTEAAPAEEKSEEFQAEVTVAQPVQESAPESPKAAVTDKTAPKKNVKMWIAAAAALILVAVIACAPKIGNAAVKLFTSPAGYFQHLLNKASDDAAEQFAKGYDTALDNMFGSDNAGSESEISITLGEDVREMIGAAADMDFDWMEKVSLLVNADTTKEAYKVDMGLALNDNRLISLIMLANMTDKMAYLQVPELNESYLGMDLEEFLEENGMDMDDINEATEMYEKLYKALPDKSKVEKLLKRYSKLAISCVEDVEQSKEEVKINDITNTFTVLEATIDEETMQDMLELIVAELKEDEDIKKIIYDVTATQEEADADEVYEEFLDELDALEEEIDDLDEEEFEIVLKLYADNEGTLMGFVAEVEEENAEITNLMVKKGSNYAYEFEVKVNGVKVVFEGDGKLTSSKLSGDFKLKAAGLKVLEMSMTDVKVKDLEDGYFNGTVSMSLGSVAVDALEEELYGFPFDLEELVLELTGKCSKNKSETTISLFEDETLIGAFSVNSEIGKSAKIKSPKEEEVVMVEEESDLSDWAADIDLDKFFESLEGKVDEDLLDMFEGLMNGEASLPGMGGYDDDYYYDDDYPYDMYEDEWY